MMTENTSFFTVKKKRRIKLRTPQYIYALLLLKYTAFYTVAFALGCLLFHLLDVQSSERFNASIISYFSVGFSGCTDVFACASLLLSACKSDLYFLIVVFTAGFTMVSGLVIFSAVSLRGFSLGFSTSYLVFAFKKGFISVEHPYITITLYSIIFAAMAAILLNFSAKSDLFCDDFKALCGNPRKIIRSKALYLHIFRFLIAFGAFLILNLIRLVF